eukprot:589491-Amorphochlora_amoeboformis.AAC.1
MNLKCHIKLDVLGHKNKNPPAYDRDPSMTWALSAHQICDPSMADRRAARRSSRARKVGGMEVPAYSGAFVHASRD